MPEIRASKDITCTFIKGRAEGLKQEVETWRVPGRDGYGAQVTGLGGGEFAFRCILYGDREAIDEWIADMEGLASQDDVEVDNDWGTTFTKLLVREVSAPSETVALHAGGIRCEIMIRGIKTAT